jgi:hypothetical protein
MQNIIVITINDLLTSACRQYFADSSETKHQNFPPISVKQLPSRLKGRKERLHCEKGLLKK